VPYIDASGKYIYSGRGYSGSERMLLEERPDSSECYSTHDVEQTSDSPKTRGSSTKVADVSSFSSHSRELQGKADFAGTENFSPIPRASSFAIASAHDNAGHGHPHILLLQETQGSGR